MSEPSTKSATQAFMRESVPDGGSQRVDGLGHSRLTADERPEAVRPPSTPARRSSDVLADHRLSLGAVEDKLRAATRENTILRSRNRQLASALADAARRGTAAHHLAHHDVLTGLPNRLLLMARLSDSISMASSGHSQLALLFIDLDDFKYVNDRLGHTVGDKLLMNVAARIRASIRADDIACRYGGDEFVVLMTKIRDETFVSSIAEKIRRRIDGCYGIDDSEVRVSASIGFAVYPADGHYGDALLKHADASMYRNKATRHGSRATTCPDA